MANRITLRSSDGEVFEVDEAVAMESQTIKHMIEDDCAQSGIPLPNVNSKILSKVIEYCRKHVDAAASKGMDDGTKSVEEELKHWDSEFVKVDQGTLFVLILAANYLNINGLLDLTCQNVADMIKGKTPKEIRKTFNIKNNFSPEEEEETRTKNQRAVEDETRTENQRSFEEEMRVFEGRTRAFEEGLRVFEEGLRVFERGLWAFEEGMRTDNQWAFQKMMRPFGQVVHLGYQWALEQPFEGGMRAFDKGMRAFVFEDVDIQNTCLV